MKLIVRISASDTYNSNQSSRYEFSWIYRRLWEVSH